MRTAVYLIGFFVGLYFLYLVIAAGFSGPLQIISGLLGAFLIVVFVRQAINEK